jgi:FtsH-binding integral membrane protein
MRVCGGILIAGLMQFFLPYNYWYDALIALVIALVFSGYVIWDTQKMRRNTSEDEYIVAAIHLYLDFVHLFLSILRIVASRRN